MKFEKKNNNAINKQTLIITKRKNKYYCNPPKNIVSLFVSIKKSRETVSKHLVLVTASKHLMPKNPKYIYAFMYIFLHPDKQAL